MRTTPLFWVGLALILIGLAIIFMGGIPHRESHSADLGPVKLKVEERTRRPVPPLVSFGIVALGGLLMIMGTRAK
ncbi:MAG TPA: hypothetical protein VGK99_16530 [Acidobacteriota bacterium]|jgi:hypothetical protein